MKAPQLILIPGLASDERLWEPQRREFADALVPSWIAPLGGETLPSYAARLAETIPQDRPLVLIGCSMGGMLACEMARRLRPKAVILVASCRSPRAIRGEVRLLRPILSRLPVWGVRLVQPLAPLAARTLRRTPRRRSIYARLCFKRATRG